MVDGCWLIASGMAAAVADEAAAAPAPKYNDYLNDDSKRRFDQV
jgi:hypothetical protein